MNPFKTSLIFVLLLQAIPGKDVFAVTDRFYKLEKFTEIDGMVSSGVNTILQDKRGYLWIGTSSGLSRYNGYQFTNFTTLEGLNNNFIKAIYEDNEGGIWIGSNQGLNYIDPARGKDAVLENIYEGAIVTSIEELDDRIVFGSNLGLHVTDENDSIRLIQLPRIRSLKNHYGVLYIGAAEGLYMLDISGGWENAELIKKHSGIYVRTLLSKTEKSLIVGSLKEIKVWVAENSGELQTAHVQSFDRISHIMLDTKGRMWVTADNGLSMIKPDGSMTSFGEKDLRDVCHFTLEDHQGNVWIATSNGLLKFTEYPFSHLEPFLNSEDKGVSSILMKTNGALIFGGAGGQFASENGIGQFKEIASLTNGKPIHKLLEDKQGRMWFTTLLQGVYQWEGGKLNRFVDPKGLLRFFTFDIEETGDGIWFGGARGLTRYSEKQFSYYGYNDGPQVPFVVDLHEDQKGRIWVAMNSGLGIIEKGAIRKLPFFNGKTCGQIVCAEDDEFYVSVNEVGIYHFRYQEDTVQILKHITVQSGLSNNNIASLHLDMEGNLWAGTDFGINKITPGGGIDIYKVRESLEQSKCYMNAIFESDEAMYFGTFDGVIKVPKNSDMQESIAPRIFITGIDILNKDYDRENVKKDTVYFNLPVNLELPHNANYLSFSFEALNYSNPAETEYSFMLQGLDMDFSAPTKERTITYPNLEPGAYTFYVKARGDDKKWSETPKSFSFVIHAPFWERWWFRISALLLLIALIAAFVNYRITRIKKVEKEKSELNKRIAEFRLAALRAQMNPHFIFNALYSIQHFITTNEKEAAINYLAKFASLIRLILENSGNSEISVEEEVKMLELYLDLERLRFDQKFDYSIEVDDFINQSETSIPYLMIQPFVENAIIHGIRNKEGNGHIRIHFDLEENDEDYINCIVEDDGIGREAAEKLKKPSPIKSQSLGLKVNRERLEILNPQKIRDTSVIIVDLKTEDNKPKGTRVEIKIPVSGFNYD